MIHLGYEINIDEASTAITNLLAEEIDKTTKPFGTYDIVKSKVEMELKTTSTIKRKDKLVKKVKKLNVRTWLGPLRIWKALCLWSNQRMGI